MCTATPAAGLRKCVTQPAACCSRTGKRGTVHRVMLLWAIAYVVVIADIIVNEGGAEQLAVLSRRLVRKSTSLMTACTTLALAATATLAAVGRGTLSCLHVALCAAAARRRERWLRNHARRNEDVFSHALASRPRVCGEARTRARIRFTSTEKIATYLLLLNSLRPYAHLGSLGTRSPCNSVYFGTHHPR